VTNRGTGRLNLHRARKVTQFRKSPLFFGDEPVLV